MEKRIDHGRCAIAILLVLVMCVSGLVLTAKNTSAGTPTPIYRGSTYTFNTADGGEDDPDGAFHLSRFYTGPGYPRAEAICDTTSGWLGMASQTAWAGVWKAVQTYGTTYFYARVDGHIKANLYSLGLAEADAWFYVRVKDLTSGQVVTDTLFRYAVAAPPILWRIVDEDFSVQINWPGNYGYIYGIEVFVKTYCGAFLVGGSIADSYGNEGAYFSQITVWSYSGGGCVAEGTEIALADGGCVPVEQLKKGQSILGYDTATGSLVAEQVLSVKRSVVNTLEVINNGALVVTPVDQPVYIRHDNFTGWVVNPVDLVVGWEMFCPLGNSWITITSISFETGKFTVYEIEASAPDTFIAEGILLDKKIL